MPKYVLIKHDTGGPEAHHPVPPMDRWGPGDSDLVSGRFMIEVESYERALEVAAYLSEGPGPGGEPLHEWVEAREVLPSRAARI